MKRFVAVLLLSISQAFATTSPASAPTAVPACSEQDELATIRPPSLIRKAGAGESRTPYSLKLGEYVTLQVPHDKYFAYFTKGDDSIVPTPVLYINDLAINGLPWTNSGCEKISFFLERTEESRNVWGKTLSKLDGKDNIPVGIGTAQKGFVTDIGAAKLMLTSGHNAFLWYLGMALLVALTFWLGASTGLVRDLPATSDVAPDPDPCTDKGAGRPFSLARVQMAWWFVLALGAYTYIWIKTGEMSNTIPDSILALMGISAGTTVLSAVVDTSVQGRLEERSCGFIRDILSDSDSISFHRFQMFVWSIVLGIIFVQKVAATLIMPDFDTQLLGLMGISSGAYLGFKIPAASAAASANNNQEEFHGTDQRSGHP